MFIFLLWIEDYVSWKRRWDEMEKNAHKSSPRPNYISWNKLCTKNHLTLMYAQWTWLNSGRKKKVVGGWTEPSSLGQHLSVKSNELFSESSKLSKHKNTFKESIHDQKRERLFRPIDKQFSAYVTHKAFVQKSIFRIPPKLMIM